MRRSRSLRLSYTLLAAVLAVSLTLFGTGVTNAGAPAPAATPPVPTLQWQACGDGLECAKLPVPLDHTRPTGDTIELSVIRMPARDKQHRIGSLVQLAGGPGQPGVELIRALGDGFYGAPLRDRFDIVGFDQRGVGGSAPVRCLTDQEAAGVSVFPGTHDEMITGKRRFAQGCERHSGALLPHLSTEAAARDLDLLRAGLGEDKLTAFAVSYGSVLGATYASLFPNRIRALALDAAVDPNLWINHPQQALRSIAQGFEAALNAFFADCKARPECRFGDGDPAGAYDRLIKRLGTTPIRAAGKDVSVPQLINADLLTLAVVITLYSQRSWPLLEQALELADKQSDGSMLLSQLIGGGREPGGAYINYSVANPALTSIICADQNNPTTVDAYDRFAEELGHEAPRTSRAWAHLQLACAFWPVKASSRYTGPFHAEGAPPILVVGTTGDPASPYTEATSLADQLASGVLLTWQGAFTHGAYGGGNACIAQAVEQYLLSAQPPRDGTTCT